jgi:site-specific DNA-cytosine methylase
MKILELFAGSRSIGTAAEEKGYEVFSVDWGNFPNIDLRCDIGSLKKEDVPFIPDMVWASPDCTTYSIAAISTHRRNRTEPFSDYAKKCDTINQHWIELIKEWLSINPNMVFFIENPRGVLRHMPWMQEFTRHTVWYCKYGDDRAKPTDIWTNSQTWNPRPQCKNFKYDSEGNIIDKHCHHVSARRGAKTGTQGRKGSYERSMIPKELCREVIAAVEEENQLQMEYRLDL